MTPGSISIISGCTLSVCRLIFSKAMESITKNRMIANSPSSLVSLITAGLVEIIPSASSFFQRTYNSADTAYITIQYKYNLNIRIQTFLQPVIIFNGCNHGTIFKFFQHFMIHNFFLLCHYLLS